MCCPAVDVLNNKTLFNTYRYSIVVALAAPYFPAPVYSGQTVAHLSNCLAILGKFASTAQRCHLLGLGAKYIIYLFISSPAPRPQWPRLQIVYLSNGCYSGCVAGACKYTVYYDV